MVIMGYTTLPLSPEQQRELVRQVERGTAAAGYSFPFFLELLDGQCCSPSARGQLHFTVFSAELPQPQRQRLADGLLQAAAAIAGAFGAVEPAVIFKPTPLRAMAVGGELLSDIVNTEKEEPLCIPS